MKKRKGFLYYFVRNKNGMIGFAGVLLIVVIGMAGTLVIPKPEGYTNDILMAPSALHWLGTDNLGRDYPFLRSMQLFFPSRISWILPL